MRRPRWVLVLAAAVLVLVVLVAGLAMMAAAALPVALVLGAAALTLVGSVATRPRGRAERRRSRWAPVRPDVADDHPGVRADEPGGEPRLRWSTSWESDPPVRAVPHTRERVAAVLAEWGLSGEPVEPTLLVVTELLSNAIDHAHGPVRLSVERSAETVRVEVRDATPDAPQLQPPDPARARGRGVHLVDALSSGWGWTPDPPGKVVWAEVPTEWPV